MKKIILSICLLVLSVINIQAQEIWMCYDLKVKKGMSEKFEQAVQKQECLIKLLKTLFLLFSTEMVKTRTISKSCWI